jgi:oxygen-independent coproporphyrinogen III oxidase
MKADTSSLIQKYNVPSPRYTSYPTVPFWKEEKLKHEDWLASIQRNLDFFHSNETSIYVHLPYCESMCTFCGCHKRITKNHAVEAPYIDGVIQEWKLYANKFDLKIKELHLGGGTPTFFSPTELQRLIRELTKNQDVSSVDFSFEAHPNNTTAEHLQTLYDLGFRRLSLGVQDYDPHVQKAIHRFQSVEQVTKVHQKAKELGYTSISHDLVFGLPKQSLEGLTNTIKETILLLPDRISLYSYAHVPWLKGNGQRGFDENDLPDNEEKRALYEKAKELFLVAGYIEIGMDHFALPSDDLAKSFENKTLHRNFMGYTTQKTNLLLGLGASSISDSWFAFAQNEKSIENYLELVNKKELTIQKGHLLNEQDLNLRKKILELMCQFETTLPLDPKLSMEIYERIRPLMEDGLIQYVNDKIVVNSEGIPFVRNVCMAFDAYFHSNQLEKPTFSKVI